MQRSELRNAIAEEWSHVRRAELAVHDRCRRLVRQHDMTDVVHQTGHLELEIVRLTLGEDVCALEAVVEDVDRVTVGAE